MASPTKVVEERASLKYLFFSAIAKLIANLAALVDVKTIVTFALVGTTCVLAYEDRVAVEFFAGIVGSVITYFFQKDKSNKTQGESHE